jgi:NAD(P)-dependent dehydrogenase (short-subunit alcohol dehydrogenase family)
MTYILITGAGGGLGREIVKRMRNENQTLICVDASATALDKIEIGGENSKIIKVCSELKSSQECSALAEITKGSGYAGLIHLAGTLEADLDRGLDEEVFDRVISSNLRSAYNVTGMMLNNLDVNNAIHIVYFSSIAYRRGAFETVAYSIAKAGIVGLTRSIAKRIGTRGVVNALAPGVVPTSMTGDYIQRHSTRWLSQIPMKRFGTPVEVANLVYFLMSEQCTYMTGQVLNIDGGAINS